MSKLQRLEAYAMLHYTVARALWARGTPVRTVRKHFKRSLDALESNVA
jgi:hypothetical protein